MHPPSCTVSLSAMRFFHCDLEPDHQFLLCTFVPKPLLKNVFKGDREISLVSVCADPSFWPIEEVWVYHRVHFHVVPRRESKSPIFAGWNEELLPIFMGSQGMGVIWFTVSGPTFWRLNHGTVSSQTSLLIHNLDNIVNIAASSVSTDPYHTLTRRYYGRGRVHCDGGWRHYCCV